MDNPLVVWCDQTGLGRNVFVLFRRTFKLADVAGGKMPAAKLHLFADTRYRLWVNGEIVAYGPARFLPSHPEYDTVDLAPWLKKGQNALVVEANSFGDNSFESAPSVGGFIAWGKIRKFRGAVDLSTPGQWKMQRSEAWDADSPLYSFAQGPLEILDLRKLPSGMRVPGFDDHAWQTPVTVARQDSWGELKPRSIPMLGMALLSPEKVLVHSALADHEEIVGGRTVGPKPDRPDQKVRCCYATNIYSPREQEVTLGLFWGPHFLNGQAIKPVKNLALGNREDYPVRLRAGWNFLYGEPELLGGWEIKRIWGILLGLPQGHGLVAAAERDIHCPATMVISEGVLEDTLRAALSASAPGGVPSTMEEMPRLDTPWQRVRRGDIVPFPARVMAWDTPVATPVDQPHNIRDLTIPAGQDWVLLFDFGSEYLGHVVVDVESPAGTILDVAYDERLRGDGLLGLYHCSHNINNADRFITAGGRERIEAFRPRGGRYIQIAVRQAAKPVVLHSLQVRQTLCPVEVTGRFESSDPVLNWTWSSGLHTLRTTLEDCWVDVWRERGLYLGDAYVFHNATATFWSDPAMIRRCLRLWAHGQYPDGQIRDCVPAWLNRPLIDYTLIWVLLLYDHVQQTADVPLVRELWPQVQQVFSSSLWQEGPHGLWTGDTGAVFIDWTTTREMRTGENGVLNAFRYAALQRAVELALLIQDRRTAAAYTTQARRVKRAFQALWHEAAGHYSAALHDSRPFPGYSAHVNVLALLYGLAEGRQARAALAYVEECLGDENFLSPTHLELYFHKYVFDMLYARGRIALAEQVLRRNWGLMKNAGAWASWECLYRGIVGEGDLCIGWSTAPMIVLARRILGVRPTPGRPREVLIAPTSATLTFARGAVAHPDGPIEVDWQIRGQGRNRRLDLDVKAPQTIQLRIAPEGPLSDLPLKMTRRKYAPALP